MGKFVSLIRSNASYRRLWISQIFGMLGATAMTVSASIAVLDYGGSARVIASVFAARSIGLFVGYVTLGGLTQMYAHSRLMISSDLIRALTTTVVAAGIVTGQFWLCPVAVLLTGLAESVFVPSARALLPSVVSQDRLIIANGLAAVTRNVFSIGGPAFAGLLILFFDPIIGVILNIACFLLSAANLVKLRNAESSPTPSGTGFRGYLQSVIEGFKFIGNIPWLVRYVGAAALQMFLAVGAWSVLLPVASQQHFTFEGAYGWLLSAAAVGGLAGGIGAGRLSRRNPASVGSLAVAAFSVGMVGVTQDSFILAAATCFIGGFGIEVGNVLFETLLQQTVPGDMLGRVTALLMAPSRLLLPISYLLAGQISLSTGPDVILRWCAAGAALVMVLLAMSRPIRELRITA